MFRILYFICCALQCAATPLFIDFRFKLIPNKLQKMICSTLFLLGGVFACLHNGGVNSYAVLILAAFVFSWFGDLVLSSSSKGAEFIIGLVSFLLAHICYIVSFCLWDKNVIHAPAITVYQIIFAAVIVGLLAIVKKKLNIKFGEMAIPVLVYASAISLMLTKAVSCGINALNGGLEYGALILVVLSAAAVMFVISDAVLVLILFKGKFNQAAELINDASYYIAQMLFAFSIMLMG